MPEPRISSSEPTPSPFATPGDHRPQGLRLAARTVLRPVSRRGRWRQSVSLRLLSALLLGIATWQVTAAVLPAAPDPGVPTVVVTRDQPLGAVLSADKLAVEPRPQSQRPQGAMSSVGDATGRVLSGPVLAGEVLTTARFHGPGQLTGLPAGSVAVSLPVPDPSLVAALRPGDAVSVLVAGSGQTVASSAVVLLAQSEDRGGLGSGPGGTAHLLVAVTPDEARAVATAMGPAMGPAGSAASFLVAVRR